MVLTSMRPFEGHNEAHAIAVSSIVDVWIEMAYRDVGDERQRYMGIIKSRGMSNSRNYNRFDISGSGVKIHLHQ